MKLSEITDAVRLECRRQKFTLVCVVYTYLLGIVISMTPNTAYNAQDEMPSLRENDQPRQITGKQDFPGKGGGFTSERQEGRMAEGQTSQNSSEAKTILQALGFSPALADAPAKPRDCFTARTLDDCVLDFVRKVRILPSGCWDWVGARQEKGHGLVRFMGHVEKTHRLALKLKMGLALAADDFVCHHCDNPPCVNPAHLYIGTHRSNMADRTRRGRTARLTGERGPRASLNQSQVDAIRAKYKPLVCTVNMLAVEYGVCATSIKNILNRKTWKV